MKYTVFTLKISCRIRTVQSFDVSTFSATSLRPLKVVLTSFTSVFGHARVPQKQLPRSDSVTKINHFVFGEHLQSAVCQFETIDFYHPILCSICFRSTRSWPKTDVWLRWNSLKQLLEKSLRIHYPSDFAAWFPLKKKKNLITDRYRSSSIFMKTVGPPTLLCSQNKTLSPIRKFQQ